MPAEKNRRHQKNFPEFILTIYESSSVRRSVLGELRLIIERKNPRWYAKDPANDGAMSRQNRGLAKFAISHFQRTDKREKKFTRRNIHLGFVQTDAVVFIDIINQNQPPMRWLMHFSRDHTFISQIHNLFSKTNTNWRFKKLKFLPKCFWLRELLG